MTLFKILFASAVLVLTTACHHNPTLPDAGGDPLITSPVSDKPLDAPKPFDLEAALLERCDTKLPKLGTEKDHVAFSLEVLDAHRTSVSRLAACAARHSKLVDVLCSNAPFKGQPSCVAKK
jgi:hypothetical protein